MEKPIQAIKKVCKNHNVQLKEIDLKQVLEENMDFFLKELRRDPLIMMSTEEYVKWMLDENISEHIQILMTDKEKELGIPEWILQLLEFRYDYRLNEYLLVISNNYDFEELTSQKIEIDKDKFKSIITEEERAEYALKKIFDAKQAEKYLTHKTIIYIDKVLIHLEKTRNFKQMTNEMYQILEAYENEEVKKIQDEAKR